MIAIGMFVFALALLLLGIPVAFVFGGVALLFALLIPELGLEIFNLLPFRIFGIMSNSTLMAVPLFIAMGLVMEKSQMAEKLLISMSRAFISWCTAGSFYGYCQRLCCDAKCHRAAVDVKGRL